MSLNEKLEEMRQASWGRWTPEKVAILYRSFEELERCGILDRALKKGQRAPDFTLKSAAGDEVSLSALLQKGPVVLAFYRGHWWRYCNAELSALQQVLEEIQKLGASLIALSPEIPSAAQMTVEKNGLRFQVLSDEGNRVARTFGLVYPLPADLRAFYQSIGIDLAVHNRDPNWELPLPATYLIGQDGIIRDAFVRTDYVKRMEPDDIVQGLKALIRS